jgi:hypothetical protein
VIATLSRSDWSARTDLPRLGYVVPAEQLVGAVLHHTVTNYVPTSNVDEVAAHMRYLQTCRPDLGLDVPYSFAIGEHPDEQSAWICEGRGLCRTGAHTAGLNSTRYGIALLGNYDNRPMSPGMVRAFRTICSVALVAPALVPTIGHRQAPGARTACPGGVAFGQLGSLQPPFTNQPPMEGQTMTITPEDVEAFLNHPMSLRQARQDGTGFDMIPGTVRGALEFTHYEAQLARLGTGSATATANTAAITASRAEEAARAAEAAARSIAGAIATGGPVGTDVAEQLAGVLESIAGTLRGAA